MVKPIRNEPHSHVAPTGQTTHKGSTTSYESTTNKVRANAGKITRDSNKTNMKKHTVAPQKAGGENLSSLVTKGSGKQRAQVVGQVASTILSKPSLANKTKIRSAHIAKPGTKMTELSKKVLGKSS
jgi:hypothetical protein